ncbi:hypothetical protein RM533_12665 [Croceicoccus sp. F390]|uniref:Uncharacterized protein n=1 Tax=Croceicoccus esteveae TaxID=3075597 RepID=A0ABU2ZKV2_9SPHN|nr:hypothetical protein [Croceicoccus sp. F390]MDT0577020.1 hypothetical protein [Croceicoccus sp. F390]
MDVKAADTGGADPGGVAMDLGAGTEGDGADDAEALSMGRSSMMLQVSF